jgi:ABC-type lipoprotein release transport system permease subunit
LTAVSIWARADLWRRRGTWAVLAVLIGLLGGASLGALIGAQRTSTSFSRFMRSSNAEAWRLIYSGTGPATEQLQRHLYGVAQGACKTPKGKVLRCSSIPGLPSVIGSAAEDIRFRILALAPVSPGPGQDRLGISAFVDDGNGDRGLFAAVDRPKLLAGARPRPDHPADVAVTTEAARTLKVHVGDTITVRAVPLGQTDRFVDGLLEPAPPPGPVPAEAMTVGPAITLHVVGIETATGDREFILGGVGSLHLSPAFLTRWPALPFRPAVAIRLRPGANPTAVQTALRTYLSGYPVNPPGPPVWKLAVVKSTRNLSGALNGFGILLAVVAVVTIGQALAREAERAQRDHDVLRAIGMSRTQLISCVVFEATVVAVPGAVLGVSIAALTSFFTPIGLARLLEPAPGFALNVAWLLIGLIAIVATVALLAAASAWRVAQSQRGRYHPPTRAPLRVGMSTTMARSALPVSALVGVNLATGRADRRRGSATIAALFGSILAVGTITFALSYDAGLSHLLNTPRLYGWSWDAYVGNPYRGLSPAQTDQVDRMLAADPAVAGFSQGTFANLRITNPARPDVAATILPVYGLDTTYGAVLPPSVNSPKAPGALLTHDNTIELGADTLRLYHVGVGDSIRLTSPDPSDGGIFAEGVPEPVHVSKPVTIVGREVVAHLTGGLSAGPLGKGGLMSLAGLQAFFSTSRHSDPSVNEFLIRFRKGARSAQELQKLRSEFEQPPFGLAVRAPEVPTALNNVGRVEQLPSVLAGLLVAAAAALLGHALITTVRRSRRDFAILQTLGFVRRQLCGSVLAQATCLVAIGVIVGLPLGFAVGTWQWHHFASQIGFVPTAPIAPATVGLVVPVMLVMANLVALSPALVAIRQRPAPALRFE